MTTYASRPGPLAIAHRGGAGLAPENTLEAFRRSYALGLRYLETDVRLTRDRQLVAFHDARLERVTAGVGRVADRTLGQLAALPVRGGGTVLSLAELVAAFPDARFTLDVKEPEAVVPLARLLRETGTAPRVCAAAARGAWLRTLRALSGGELCTALSWRELLHLTSRPRGRYGRAAFAHVPLRLGLIPVFRDDLVARAHEAGIRIVVWTVNDPWTMHRLLDAGVDGLITDRPDRLREVLLARGQWLAPDAQEALVG